MESDGLADLSREDLVRRLQQAEQQVVLRVAPNAVSPLHCIAARQMKRLLALVTEGMPF